MKKSFWGIVWLNFIKIQGPLLAIIGIALWFFSPQATVSLRLLLLIVILGLVILFTLASTAYEFFTKSKQFLFLPKVIRSKKITVNQKPYLIFLLESSELFSYDFYVSFYYLENEFEQLIAIGRVSNIQQDSRIQVEVIYLISGCEEILNRLANNDSTALEKTKVKPNIPKAYIDGTL